MPGLDYSRGHGPVWGTINGAVCAAAVASVCEAFGVSPWYVLFAGVPVASVAAGSAALKDLAVRSVAWRGAVWLAAAGWAWWALTHEAAVSVPLTGRTAAVWWAREGNWIAWIIGTVLTAISAGVLASVERKEQVRREELRERAQHLPKDLDEIADSWERRIARVCSIGRIEELTDTEGKPVYKRGQKVTYVKNGVEIFGVEFWPNVEGTDIPAGVTIDGVLPEGGSTWENIARNAHELAGDARLKTGCKIRVEEGSDRGSFLMHVQLYSAYGADTDARILYPAGAPLRTINNPLPLGKEPTGGITQIELRRASATLVAQVDSGKTNTLQVIGRGVMECVDTLVWDIDFSGGLSRPWVAPYVRGDATHPCVDWAARDPLTGLLMCELALRAAKGRKIEYGDIMSDAMVPVAPSIEQGGVPEIVIRVDEGGTLPSRIRDLLEQVADVGRGGAVRVVWCGLRGVDEYVPTSIKEQSATRMGMRVSDGKEYHFLFGHELAGKIDTSVILDPGIVLVSTHGGPIRECKAFWTLSEKEIIYPAAVELSKRRPAMDVITREMLDQPVIIADSEGNEVTFENVYSHRIGPMLFSLFPRAESVRERYGQEVVEMNLLNSPAFMSRHTLVSEGEDDDEGKSKGKKAKVAASAGTKTPPANRGGTPMSTEDAFGHMKRTAADMGDAMAAVEAAAQQAEARRAAGLPEVDPRELETDDQSDPPANSGDGEGDEPPPDVPDTADELLRQWGMAPPAPPAPRTYSQAEKVKAMLELVEEVSPERGQAPDPARHGVRASDLIEQLRGVGITDSDQNVYRLLGSQLDMEGGAGTITQPWGRGAGAADSPKGRYVITDRGRQALGS